MKGAFISLCLLVALFASVNSPLAQDIGNGGWEPYMSSPKNQMLHNEAGAPTCQHYSSIHALEGLYNYLFNLSSSKLSIDPFSARYGATPGQVFSGISGNGCRAMAELNCFPNYDYAFYSLSDYSETRSPTLYWMETYIQQAPICIYCGCYAAIQGTV